MPVVPVLMVLYTNDAIEVRYSDGSCLKMSACGSTFVHHQSPGETIHPAHGMKVISQRCQFATSDYRQKVLEAIDFRNRFAERPYVCPDLILQDQLVSLYADIRDVAWPQTLDKATYEYLPDGSVRLMSEDKHASMVLSTHRQDFTVCYLSKVSQDKPKVKVKHNFKAKSMTSGVNQISPDSRHEGFKPRGGECEDPPGQCRLENRNVNSGGIETRVSPKLRNVTGQLVRNVENIPVGDTVEPNDQHIQKSNSPTEHYNDLKKGESSRSNEGEGIQKKTKGCISEASSSPLSDDFQHRLPGDLSISPISLVSGLRSEKSSPCTEEEYRRYSTPTFAQNDARNAQPQQGGFNKAAAYKQYKRQQHQDDGSFLDYPPTENKNDDVDSALDETLTSQNVSHNSQKTRNSTEYRQNGVPKVLQSGCRQFNTNDSNQNVLCEESESVRGKKSNEPSPSYRYDREGEWVQQKHSTRNQSGERIDRSWEEPSIRNQSNERKGGSWEEYSPAGSQSGSMEEAPESRTHYSWVTRHYSCEECPVVWSHPVNLARAVLDNRESVQQKALKLSSNPKKNLSDPHTIRRDKCVLSTLPRPLPLSCEGKHLHSLGGQYLYDDDKDLETNLTVFKQGKLKVLLIEGVVFRLVRLATTKVVEIFPGDGSVITSQGLSGHFFKHILPHGHDQVEERTYSLKSAPPTPPKAAYSIEKLIKRAHRFLQQASQEDKMITNADICCWKYVEKKLELLPTTLLEDCCVPNHGKFSAYSNGHVRILFDDRTSLEMTADFSQRVKSCLKHSDHNTPLDDTQVEKDDNRSILVTKQHLTSKQSGLCKLLLPNGHYQIVDINHPGVYKRYTDAAVEWQAWVNSSPGQRRDFYERWDKQDSHNVLAAKELQKIKCFNYIVDNTVSKQKSDMTSQLPSTTQRMDQVQYSDRALNTGFSGPYPGVMNRYDSSQGQRHSSQGHYDYGVYPHPVQGHLTSEWYPSNSSHNHHGYSIPPKKSPNSAGPGLYSVPGSQLRGVTVASTRNSLDTLQGFNAVREALLKTSKAIQDIDGILDKKS